MRTAGASRSAGRSAATALVLITVVVSELLAAIAPTPAAAYAPDTGVRAVDPLSGPTARIDLSTLGPTLVDPTATLTVTGSVSNTSLVPLDLVSARLRLLRSRLGTREQVADWMRGTDERTGTVVGPTLDLLPRSIGVAGRTAFALAVPASQLGLAGQPFGAYGIAIEVRAQRQLGRAQVALLRTTMQWQPGRKEYAAQQLAWLVPLTGLPIRVAGARPDAYAAEVAAAVGPGSRLARVLQAASAPGVSWAVDPALLQALDQVAHPPSPLGAPTTDAGAQAVVSGFLAELRKAAAAREVVELPYADPDLAAISANGRPDLLRSAQESGAGIIAQVLGVSPVSGVAWPAEGWASEAALRVIAAAGSRDVVLDARSRRLVDPLPYTSDARTELAGGLSGWLADPTLSGLSAGAHGADVGRVQRLLAETAAATSERTGLTRRLLVAAPRDLDPDPAAFRALVDATTAVPWLTVVPVTALRGPAPGSGSSDPAKLARLATSPPPSVNRAQLPATHVAAVRRMRGALAALGEVVDSPGLVTDDLQRSTLGLLSTAWRGHPSELRTRRADVAAQVRGLTDKVRVLRSSVNFLTSSGRLQITVANDLAEAVAGLRLRLTSTNPRLRVREHDVATPRLAARTKAQVQVPVQAIASGVVLLNAQLISPSGRLVGQSVQVRVRAQPTGTWALWVLGAVAALVLAIGLVRALRRPRRAHLEALEAP